MKIILRFILSLSFLAFSRVYADSGIGVVAQNLIEPVSILSGFVSTASLIIGVSFLFGALMRYMQYRQNPLAVPLSTVVMLFIMGLILVLLPLAYMLTENGIPYHYFK